MSIIIDLLTGTTKLRDAWPKINTNFTRVKAEVDAIVLGSANAEVGQAHVSTVKGKTFAVIDDRFEESEQDLVLYQADNALQLVLKAKQSDLVIERARIDNFVAMPPTVDNIETTDVRVGADGVSYASAGEAVRKQLARITSILDVNENYVNQAVTTLVGVMPSTGILNSAIGNHAEFTNLVVGDVFKISGYVYNADYPLIIEYNGATLVSFKKNDLTTTAVADYLYAVPDGINKIIVNSNTVTPILIKKLTLTKISEVITIYGVENYGVGNYVTQSITTVPNVMSNVGTEEIIGTHASLAVTPGDKLKITGYVYNAAYPLLTTYNAGLFVGYAKNDLTNTAVTDYIYTVPSNVDKIIVNSNISTIIAISKLILVDTGTYIADAISSLWKNKKIAWFGTSIPAGDTGYGLTSSRSYPKYLGTKLGALLVNESVGASCVSCKNPSYINATTNPYGFSLTDFNPVSRCMTNTIAEMQWIIANYNSPIFTLNVPSSMTTDISNGILDYSYENMLNRHLGVNAPDLYVFDHGHNDGGTIATDADLIATYGEKTLYCFTGAMNFLFNKIKEDNPQAKIVIIGEYENVARPDVGALQTSVANSWNIPIFKLWEKLGWNRTRKITTSGYWSNGLWVPSGGASQQLTVMQCWVADGVHPHTDLSDKALNFITDNLYAWFANEVR